MTALTYTDHDGVQRTIEGCNLTIDKAGRYWLWSEQLKHNLAFKERSKEDCLLSAINSLLFTIELKDNRIADLQRIADLAMKFAEEVNPNED
jgi:hypothetical protein